MPAFFDSGFVYKEQAWHGLATVVEHALTAEEAIVAAGLDWEVGLVELVTADGRETPWFATERKDTGELLGSVGNRYTPVQNRDLFTFFDPVVNRAEGAFYHTGGVLKGGRRVWLLAKVPYDFWVPGVTEDLIQSYVLLAAGHDASLQVIAEVTDVRVVCWNTLRRALEKKERRRVTIRHTSGALERLAQAHEVIGLAAVEAEKTRAMAEAMLSVKIGQEYLRGYLKALFPSANEDRGEKPSKKARTARNMVQQLFEFGANNILRGMRGTGWGLYNATAEYCDYLIPLRKDTDPLDRIWFGQSAQVKEKAAALLLKEARG